MSSTISQGSNYESAGNYSAYANTARDGRSRIRRRGSQGGIKFEWNARPPSQTARRWTPFCKLLDFGQLFDMKNIAPNGAMEKAMLCWTKLRSGILVKSKGQPVGSTEPPRSCKSHGKAISH